MSGKRLSLEQRAEIATLHSRNGVSIGNLAAQFSLSKSSVHNIVTKKQRYGTVVDRPHTGRKRMSTQRDDRNLIRMAMADRHQTAASLRRNWTVKASLTTVKTRLHAAGLRGCVATRKPMLKACHKSARRIWCLEKRNWSVAQWENFRFTDESSFALIPNSHHLYVRRRQNERFRQDCLAPSTRWRSPTLMVWGAIGANGVGPLHRCDGNVNQHAYMDILAQHLQYFHGAIIVQDNAPCHKALSVRNFLHDYSIQHLHLPSISPDLNPIENMWAHLKRNIRGKCF